MVKPDFLKSNLLEHLLDHVIGARPPGSSLIAIRSSHKMDIHLIRLRVWRGHGRPAPYGFIFSWPFPPSGFHPPLPGYLPRQHSSPAVLPATHSNR